ncbi:MAG TPA: SDR family oxidoreductase [Balneolales bacterium]|nr:SDR family oxidoreductase [Balneolales bacterium]
MDLSIINQRFIVCGASSGLGRAIAENLLEEGSQVIAIARRANLLQELQSKYGKEKITVIPGDLRNENTIRGIEENAKKYVIHGILLNAGGPPAKKAIETTMDDWDEAYHLVMRWKINLTKRLLPYLMKQEYGRILFLESQSIKQPVESLVLSNAYRAGIAGFAKTLALEIASSGVTVNIIAPGSHDSPAIERVIQKAAEQQGISYQEAQKRLEDNIPVKRIGKPGELAKLAVWMLSPLSGYMTGQIINHDGGFNKSLFG